jgi:CelD/BcsL family acetyltransferase involved in cellulose biosynthesis
MTAAPPERQRQVDRAISGAVAEALVELDANSPNWLEFLGSRPDATPFHHPAWLGTLATCYGYSSAVLALVAGGRVVGGLPTLTVRRPLSRARVVSLPFTDHLPVLVAGEEWRSRLAAAVVAWSAASGKAVEVRGDLSSTPGVERRISSVGHVLALSANPESVLPRLNHRARRGLSRARRGPIQTRVGASEEALRDFYRLHLQTRRRLGVPIQPRRFFDLLWERMLDRGLGFCVTALLDGRAVAAAVFLDWNGTVVYKFGASDPAYWRLFPNHLLFWTAIRHGCEEGAAAFDLGCTDLDHHSLRTFKSEWGVERPLVTSGIGASPPARPEGAAQRLLAAVIQHSPTPVCRAIGELLYRYFP